MIGWDWNQSWQQNTFLMHNDSKHQVDFSADHDQQDITKDESYFGTQLIMSQHSMCIWVNG